LFVEAYAPADYNETVNTLALARYTKTEALEFNKGWAMESQMNVLPLCTMPRALFSVRATPYTRMADQLASNGNGNGRRRLEAPRGAA
jgi:hypothetical protein